jgi:hypothetical protein
VGYSLSFHHDNVVDTVCSTIHSSTILTRLASLLGVTD